MLLFLKCILKQNYEHVFFRNVIFYFNYIFIFLFFLIKLLKVKENLNLVQEI